MTTVRTTKSTRQLQGCSPGHPEPGVPRCQDGNDAFMAGTVSPPWALVVIHRRCRIFWDHPTAERVTWGGWDAKEVEGLQQRWLRQRQWR
jgi:hypothetical protein